MVGIYRLSLFSNQVSGTLRCLFVGGAPRFPGVHAAVIELSPLARIAFARVPRSGVSRAVHAYFSGHAETVGRSRWLTFYAQTCPHASGHSDPRYPSARRGAKVGSAGPGPPPTMRFHYLSRSTDRRIRGGLASARQIQGQLGQLLRPGTRIRMAT